MISQNQRDLAHFLFKADVLKFGDFTLKSGRQSPYFLNLGSVCSGEDTLALGSFYARAIKENFGSCDVVFGPPYKGIPLCVATAQACVAEGLPQVAWTFSRKEAKTHGDKGMYVGATIESGVKVVLVDDVITAGTAQREILPVLIATGAEIAGALVAVDRCEPAPGTNVRATESIEKEFDVPVRGIISIFDAVTVLLEENRIDQDQVDRMQAYWKEVKAL